MSPLRYQKWLRLNEVRRPMLNEHYDVTTAAYAVVSVTKAIPFQSGIFADVWRVTQERYYQVKKVCRSALINPALICLEQFGVSFSKQTLTIANDL